MSLSQITNLCELEGVGSQALPLNAFGYYRSGAETETSLQDNRKAFHRYRIRPRVLRDVSDVDTSVQFAGMKLNFPVIIAPMALQQMAHYEGELATARAAHQAGTCMMVSTMANYGVEEIAATGSHNLMFQLYVFRDRELVKNLVQMAERCGYKALVVTVDAPLLGKREMDIKNRFQVPAGMFLKNAEMLPEVRKLKEAGKDIAGSFIAQLFAQQIDASLTWDIIPWLRTITNLPIYVKGIMTGEDAMLCLNYQVDGIVVSNHGGRQLDYAPASLDVLPEIAQIINKQIPIFVDGGIRRGTDVIKALALGADCVLLGRPILYGLALDGQQGVEKVLEIIREEIKLSMALMGVQNVSQIDRFCLMDISKL